MIKKRLKIKKGDNVRIISGKYRGKSGKVTQIMPKKNYLTVNNINLKTKHIKPNNTEEKGQIKEIEGPIHYSNVKIIINIKEV